MKAVRYEGGPTSLKGQVVIITSPTRSVQNLRPPENVAISPITKEPGLDVAKFRICETTLKVISDGVLDARNIHPHLIARF